MMLASQKATVRPKDLWLVTDGTTTVGPVATELLLRGIQHGRVPDDCMVKQAAWSQWRALRHTREIAQLVHPEREIPEDARRLLKSPADLGEGLLVALQVACRMTRASVGLAHRVRGPWFVTSAAYGGATVDELGQLIPSYDPAYELACAGRTVNGTKTGGMAARAILTRLGIRAGGHVLMAPLLQGGGLLGMVELGRQDHPFRTSDRYRLKAVLRALAS